MSQIVPSSSEASRKRSHRQRRVVLSEEEYTSTLEEIVQRDYFPDLPALQRQAAVLEKRAMGDIAGAVAVRRAARQLQNHEEALAEKEANDEQDLLVVVAESGGRDVGLRRTPRPLHRETVTGFHARVTSEDNREFDKTQQEEIQAQRQRRKEAFQQSNPALLRITNSTSRIESETPLLASDQFNAPLNRIEASQWNDTSQQRDSVFFTPQRNESTTLAHGNPTESTRMITEGSRDKSVSSAAALMPPPASVSNKRGAPSASSTSSLSIVAHELAPQLSISSSSSAPPKALLVEYTPKNTLIKRIEPSQTRFPSKPSDLSLLSLRKKRGLEGDASSAIEEYSTDATSASSSTDLEETSSLTLSQERTARARRQRRDQETLVAMTPLVIPGRRGEERQGGGETSPLITWGTVASTPLVLSGGVDVSTHVVEPTPFALPKEDRREEAARRAELKLAKLQETAKSRKRKVSAGSSGTSRNNRTRESLTPAARSLLDKTSASSSIFSSSVRSRGAFGSALRSSYTPKSRSTQRGNKVLQATPRSHRSTTTTTSAQEANPNQTPSVTSGNITDGLLKLPNK